jgi:nucleotide-binding universal stress UspA family protein
MPTMAPQTWIVGLDFDERCLGALVFADWLTRAGDAAVGVHVLESWTRPHLRADLASLARDRAEHAARALGLTPLARVDTLEAVRAEDGLARVCAERAASGLVIGRAARSDQTPFVRLGVVARQLLRRLPAPVIVAPPDRTTVGGGPILLATDLGESSEAAVVFAQALAERQGRPLELVHVGEPRHNDLIDELEPAWIAAREAYHAEVAGQLHRWAGARGLPEVPRHSLFGDPAARIAAVAAARDAALVVVGSRGLGLAARAFLSSTASALAGLASCPVAVVPLG